MKTYCPDCGPAAVSHGVERWSVRMNVLIGVVSLPFEIIWRFIKPGIAMLRLGRMAPRALRACAALGLGTILDHADEKDNWRNRVLWEEAEKRDIVMREFRPAGLPRDIFFASHGNDSILFDGLPRPRNAHESSLRWMDDKGFILHKLGAAGVPIPRGGNCTTFVQAEKMFREIVGNSVHPRGAVVVKPNIGSRSRHTYVHIADLDALHHAFVKAKELSPYVVVEEELLGFVFRVTLIGGKIGGVMRREPPHVIGDGVHTVRALVDEENKNPLRHGPIFHTLELGKEAEDILKTQGLSFDAVPKKGLMVVLHSKVSRSFGASTTEMANIHPENEKIFLTIARVLDDPIVGVDFMIEDMARSWKEQRCGVIECNSLPFIDLHHYPLKGTARNTAGMVWDLVWPQTGMKK